MFYDYGYTFEALSNDNISSLFKVPFKGNLKEINIIANTEKENSTYQNLILASSYLKDFENITNVINPKKIDLTINFIVENEGVRTFNFSKKSPFNLSISKKLNFME